ncbi:hypothetical protein [Pseudolysinimonas sp.]|jgi:hypothetical protein|uniref:hypothetical protein n=1 Tax=Pseudolysinimonas sp. TaxID=2680009 RepID=UPI0037848A30
MATTPEEDAAADAVVEPEIEPEIDPESFAETIVVDREAEAETVVVDRIDRTVVVDRGSAPDGTVAVTRERGQVPPPGRAIPAGRRRRGMTMPPVAPGFGRGAVDAVGPGAVASYEPRAIPEVPAETAPFEGAEATRTEAPSMPSVARRSRRGALTTLVLFAGACVVSVAGLIALGIAVVAG